MQVHTCTCTLYTTVHYFYTQLTRLQRHVLPGRVPGYEESDVKLLASTIIKQTIWELYLQAAATISMRAVAHLTFTQLWRQRSGDEADERLVLDLSAEQWSHHAFENRPEEEKSTVSIHASVVW